MTPSTQPPKLKPPNLWPPVGMSKKEHEATKFLHATVMSLAHFVEAFAAAMELYRFSVAGNSDVPARTTFQWKWFALHEGAMAIWHLRESLNLVPRRIGPCATVARLVDRKAMQRAKDLFDKQYFVDFEPIRDAIAHAPTISLTMDNIVLDDGLLASPRIKDGDIYEVINRGKRYEFSMTEDTMKKMVDVVTTYWSGFAPVVKAFDDAGRSD